MTLGFEMCNLGFVFKPHVLSTKLSSHVQHGNQQWCDASNVDQWQTAIYMKMGFSRSQSPRANRICVSLCWFFLLSRLSLGPSKLFSFCNPACKLLATPGSQQGVAQRSLWWLRLCRLCCFSVSYPSCSPPMLSSMQFFFVLFPSVCSVSWVQ